MIQNKNLHWVAILGLIAVVCGAFGSHALKTHLSPELFLAWRTAVEYQFYHTLALFLCGFLPKPEKPILDSSLWFIYGIICFSGSLYLISILSLFSTSIKIIGILTPLGGLFFILGWFFLFFRKTNLR